MALPEESKNTTEKSNTNNTHSKLDKREKPQTKVVIRRLPPAIDKDTLLNQISPVPSHDYFYLVNGESALGENSFSRAYLNFLNPNDVFDFKEKFDNYVFLDHKGNEYAAVVEFAAFQKIPKKRNKMKVDPKCGSIETDPYYSEFVENLNKPVEQEDKPEYSYQFLAEMKDKDAATTPLLEFVKNRRVERMRIREERREERKRKELERKKLRDEERKKRFEEKSPLKVPSKTKVEEREISDTDVREEKDETTDIKNDKVAEKSSFFKGKEKKFDDRKKEIKPKHPIRKDFPEKREFKNRKDHFKEQKFDSFKKEEKQFPKKVKKYSEKREERKIEAQKAEMKKAEEMENKKSLQKETEKDETKNEIQPVKKEHEEKESNHTSKSEKDTKKPDLDSSDSNCVQEKENKCKKEGESENLKETGRDSHKSVESKESRRERIRNKDRPTIAIYRPGMLSKRKLTEGDGDKDSAKEVNLPLK